MPAREFVIGGMRWKGDPETRSAAMRWCSGQHLASMQDTDRARALALAEGATSLLLIEISDDPVGWVHVRGNRPTLRARLITVLGIDETAIRQKARADSAGAQRKRRARENGRAKS